MDTQDSGRSVLLEVPRFRYEYPRGFTDAEQNSIRAAIQKAYARLPAMLPETYDGLASAREAWFWDVLSAAMPIFGVVAARHHWSDNHGLNELRKFATALAQTGRITRAAFRRIIESDAGSAMEERMVSLSSQVPSGIKGGRPKGKPVDAGKLRQFRGEYSQEDFAAKCGVDVSTIQRGEARGSWDNDTYRRVARGINDLRGANVRPADLQQHCST